MALLYFALTLFVSAFLLFLVQPIIGKMILPKLGGTPQVWNTCMVFFQTTLLAGYFYTHAVSTYMPTRRQIIVHCLLLFVPFLFLIPGGPFNVIEWVPPPGGNPIFATLALLTVVVGVPFFVVATSAPLLQKWFAHTGHPAAKDPYFLYGASNLGSMLALLLYPVLIEPWFRLQGPVLPGNNIGFDLGAQSWFWTAGYAVLVLLVIGCGVMAYKGAPPLSVAGVGAAGAAARDLPPANSPAVMETPSDVVAPPIPAENATPLATTSPPAADQTAATGVTAAPPAPAAATAAAPRPMQSSAIKQGSKQQKKQKGKQHKHQHPPKKTQEAFAKPEHAQQIAATTPTTAGPAATAAPSILRDDAVPFSRKLRWVGLAAVPCSLMLAVTTYMSEDISAIPLFWVLPLSLYLLSFILVFMRWPFNWIDRAHTAMLILQPIVLGVLVVSRLIASYNVAAVMWPITINLLAFFVTALACHGELAKDRPSTKHLTVFYLCMSLGGMLGGMFNGLVAPILFPGLWEYNIALILAGFLRPRMKDEGGWTDQLVAGVMSDQSEAPAHRRGARGHVPRRAGAEPTEGMSRALDILLPISLVVLAVILNAVLPNIVNDPQRVLIIGYGLPLLIACFYYARPLRFGLALAAIILLIVVRQSEGRGAGSILTQRSYFGILNIRLGSEHGYLYRTLTHGTTQHGQNFLKPGEPEAAGRNKLDLSRLATTYYHRTGPVGMAMERFDWFVKFGNETPGADRFEKYFKVDPQNPKRFEYNLYASDARSLASLAGLGGGVQALGTLPDTSLVGLWAEPPFATIGLGTGTMAGYARPGQTTHFYEIDDRVRLYSLPEDNTNPYFWYLQDARKRGAQVNVLMGDARLRMAQPWVPRGKEDEKPWNIDISERGGPESFYHLIVVDAFSSDAIPVHLLTKEAVQMYMSRLVSPQISFEKNAQGEWVEKYWPGGVLCVHVSNRHLNLVPVVADIANAIKVKVPVAKRDANDKFVIDPSTGRPIVEWQEKSLAARRGRDNAPGHEIDSFAHIGHTTSEWVMVTRDERDLKGQPGRAENWALQTPTDYEELRERANRLKTQKGYGEDRTPYWSTPTTTGTPEREGRYVWTDDYSNLLAVFRWPWSRRVEE